MFGEVHPGDRGATLEGRIESLFNGKLDIWLMIQIESIPGDLAIDHFDMGMGSGAGEGPTIIGDHFFLAVMTLHEKTT